MISTGAFILLRMYKKKKTGLLQVLLILKQSEQEPIFTTRLGTTIHIFYLKIAI
jgi:hypothetical protein